MKDPKTLFPFLFGSSWLGNLILTLLAFFLAFTHDGPLTPLVLLTVALCIMSGNLLPIATYLIFTRWREAELRAEASEANVRVRDALKRSEEVIGRLDIAEGALSKIILVARQIPERIGEGFKSVEDLLERLDTLEISSFTETLEGQSSTLTDLLGEIQDFQKGLAGLKSEMDGIPKSLQKLVEAIPKPGREDTSDGDISLGERLDLVYESLESVQDSLDGLLQRMADLGRPVPVSSKAAPSPEPSKARPEGPAQEEMALKVDSPPSATVPESPPADGKIRLSVRAMVGIQNKLYIRGDEPWLSWEEGQPMDLVGIGEFSYQLDDASEPIEVSVLLNDEIESEAGTIALKPGKPLRLDLRFPKG